MAKVINGVRYANGEEPRTTTAGPGQPAHTPLGEVLKRLERLEEHVGIEHAEAGTAETAVDAGAPEGAADTGEATGEKQDGETPAKRPTARRVETK